MKYPRFISGQPMVLRIAACWLGVVLLFAVQWFLYDATRGSADVFRYYLWWSFYLWGILTPVVVWFSLRHAITAISWKSVVPVHFAAGLGFVGAAILGEAMIGKLWQHQELSAGKALRHYFLRHAQVSLFTYGMLVVAVELYRMLDERRKQQLRASRLEAQLTAAHLEALRAQLHPHFLFNTLQAATTLIQEDPDGAEDILIRLSEILRVSFDQTNIQEVPLSKEIEILGLYIGIQARRFGDRLNFEVSVDPDVRECMVPALILQPLVENAIRHGISKHKGVDEVQIRGFQKNGSLCLEVRNQNSYLEEDALEFRGHGIGLANTRMRLEQLYGIRQALRLQNLQPTGVCAAVFIPLRPAPSMVRNHRHGHPRLDR